MPRKYIKKNVHLQYNKENLRQAIETALLGKDSIRNIAKYYEVPISTLRRRVFTVKQTEKIPQNIEIGRFRPTFTLEQEEQLKQYVIDSDKMLAGITPLEFRKLVYEYAENNKINHRFNRDSGLAGEDWYYSFMSRHSELKLRTPEKTSVARAYGFNKQSVNSYFNLLTKLIDKYHFSPSNIYNVDETGITSVPNTVPKVISIKGKKQVGSIVSAERGETVTCVLCCNAAGYFVPPLMIFPRKKNNLEFVKNTPPDTKIICHPSGWMQTDIFYPTWFDHFKKFANPSQDNAVLLILR